MLMRMTPPISPQTLTFWRRGQAVTLDNVPPDRTLLDLLARIDLLRATGFPPETRVTQAAFASGALELGVEVAGMDAVETLRSALNEAGLNADTLSAEATDGKVVARLRVQVGS